MHVITRSCVLFLWIHTLSLVKSQDCTREQFLNSNLFDSNFDTTSLEESYPGGRQVRVGCNVGFSGFFKLLCVEGKWQPKGTKCQPRSCGHPGDTQFADFHLEKGDDFVFGSQVVYTCQKGYQMVSRTNVRNCMAEGWDGVVPVCEAQQCPVIHVDDTVQVIGDTEEANYGNVIRFSCKSSSEILVGPSEIYCDENGEWSAQKPHCQEIECTVPVIENGYLTESIRSYKEHEILHFKCDQGFSRTQRPSKCTKVGTSAEFSPTPVCELTKCILPRPLEGTRFNNPTNKNVFRVGDTIEVICTGRFWTSILKTDSSVSTCSDKGEWEPQLACEEISCENRRHPHLSYWDVYWGQRLTLDETVRYKCKTGYKSTSPRATCTRNGWMPNPLCQEITCNRHDVPNTDIVNEGYNKPIYKYNDRVRYVCKDGYQGQFTLTCNENGWTGHPRCTKAPCTKIDINNAYITRNNKATYRHDEEVQYTCENSGKDFKIRCDKGNWTGTQSCQECEKIEIPNGFVVAKDTDKVYFTCDEGYKLPSKAWWGEAKCIDRNWSGFERCIENSVCGEIPMIPNAKLTQQPRYLRQQVQITCNYGYRAQLDRLTCQEGNWHLDGLSPDTICIPVSNPCKPPPKVENAVVLDSYKKYYLSYSEVTYQCRNEFIMLGENKILCKDGQWEQKNITCAPPTAPTAPTAPTTPTNPTTRTDSSTGVAPQIPPRNSDTESH